MKSFKIIYKDEDYLVVDKSPLIPCHPLDEASIPTLIELLAKQYPEVLEEFAGEREGGLCHRIDNGTSGLVTIARNRAAKEYALALFKAGEIEKTYLALVHGKVEQSLEIVFPIAHHPKNKKKMVALTNPNRSHRGKAKAAKTLAKVLLSNEKASLLRVEIGAGRRHQIRAHLTALGHPLFGDALYGGPQSLFLQGHALHAETIVLPNRSRIEAPCPALWEEELVSLQLIAAS